MVGFELLLPPSPPDFGLSGALSERALWQHLQSSGGHPFFGTYRVISNLSRYDLVQFAPQNTQRR